MTSADSPQTCYQRVPAWLHRLSAGKVILVRRGSDPKAIQGLAVTVWLLLENPTTEAHLREEIASLTAEAAPSPDSTEDPETASSPSVASQATSESQPNALDEALAILCEQGIIEAVPEFT